MRTLSPTGTQASHFCDDSVCPEGAKSFSPGQASAPPWVLVKKKFCPEGAASRTGILVVPFGLAPKLLRGFSLVEVVLALGIITFGLIAVMGLLPTGLRLTKQSADEVAAVNIMTGISVDIQSVEQTNKKSVRSQSPVWTDNSGKAYFNPEGKWLGNSGPYDEVAYVASWTRRASSNWSPPTALITVSWPAITTIPTGSVESIVVLSEPPN